MMEWIFIAFNAFLATFFLIVAPPVISCVIVVECTRMTMKGEPKYRNWLKDNKLVKYAFSLHPNKGLSSQGLFWLAIMMPLTYFIFLGVIAWRGYIPRLDAEGFKTFISISALPLGVLSLALPLSVSVARFHSSKQTARQIEIVSQKNNVDLFHAHRKELFSYFSQIGKVDYLGVLTAENKIHPVIHKDFFVGKQSAGTPNLNAEAFSNVDERLGRLIILLDDIIKNESPGLSWRKYISIFCPDVYQLALYLGLSEILKLTEKSVHTYPIEGKKYITLGVSSAESVASVRYIYDFYKNLCDFSGYEPDVRVIQENCFYIFSGKSFKDFEPKVIERIVQNLSHEKTYNISEHRMISIH